MGRRPDIGHLFHLHREELQRFVERRLGDRENASDVVQDAFLRAASTFASGTAEAIAIRNPRAFLFRVTRNLTVDALRRGRVASEVMMPAQPDENSPDPAPSPETETVDRATLRRLGTALAALPAAQREVMMLKRLQGLSHAEIAERTGQSPAAVEKNLTRALRCLRDQLADAWP